MDETLSLIDLLKELLKREVERFCRAAVAGDEFIRRTVEEVRQNHWQAVFFGGTLRSLLISRLTQHTDGRPRDVDIVIQGPPLEILRNLFASCIARETRFGGLQLRQGGWQFDVWPLERTWALVADGVRQPAFDDLPRTTFLNLEAAAIDLWPQEGKERRIYSGDDQFFRGILDRVVEVNREDNPFPDLCVVRSLVMASEVGFALGPRLAAYVARHGTDLTAERIEAVQQKHYGQVRIPGPTLSQWIGSVADSVVTPGVPLRLPFTRDDPVSGRGPQRGYEYLQTVRRWHEQRTHHPA